MYTKMFKLTYMTITANKRCELLIELEIDCKRENQIRNQI